ncbi:MAG: AAA family ATPase [Candidatus Obscuribacterales bacterium]|nr:AAA family ATPase [Candidatus Obscuribacterales bacterium]
MKNFFEYLKDMWSDELFKKTVLHFTAFFVAVASFYLLTTNHVITRTPQKIVPVEYSTLVQQGKTMSAVELEQALRKKSSEVQGLVFIDGMKSVVVIGDGLEKDKIVPQSDTEVMRKLAKEADISVKDVPASVESDLWSLLPSGFMWIVGAFAAWFVWLLFYPRENGTVPSRMTVAWHVVPQYMDGVIDLTRLQKSTFYLVLLGALIVGTAAGGYFRLFHTDALKTSPSDIAVATRIQPWQITRHLDTHAGEFQRATVVEELNTAYIVLNTNGPLPPVIVNGANTNAGKTGPITVDRTVVFADKASFNTFVEQMKDKKIDVKPVAAERNTGFFESMTGGGMIAFFILSGMIFFVGTSVLANWKQWQDDDGSSGSGSGRGYGGGGSGGDVEVRDEDRKTFADVAGCQEAIDELRVVEKKIRRPRLYKVFGAPVPSGVMLYGPPGTGKTLLARALAGEIGGSFQALAGSQFVEMYVGVGAKRVREAYAKARADARKSGRISIVFIDEIDAIGKKRGASNQGGDKEYEQTLNELLVQMNGFGNHGLVLTMAATNRLDILDEALLRPGRFDIKVKVPKPDKKGRAQIYKIYLKKLKIVLPGTTDAEKDAALEKLIDDLARRSHDFSGAEIEGAVKDGATIAVERQFGEVTEDITEAQVEEYKAKAIITPDDLNLGIDKMAYGTQIRSRVRTDKERWATSVHEIGHATVPTVLNGDPVNRITIVMTDKSLGLMDSSPPEGERYDWTDEQFITRLKMMLAGRAAEKILLGKISTGASNDFERASQLARQMVGVYGMTKEFGVKSIPLDQNGFPSSQVGETMMVKFNNAWGDMIDRLEKETDAIIEAHRVQIEAAAKALFEEETLTGDEFRKIWAESAPKK